MALAPGEQRTLEEIENQLRSSDPQLDAMFTRLAGRDGRAGSVTGRCPPGAGSAGGSARTIVLLAADVALLIACITLAVVAGAAPRPGYRPGTTPSGHPAPTSAGAYATADPARY